MDSSIAHEKAVVMGIIAGHGANYSGIKTRPDYLERIHSMPARINSSYGSFRPSGEYHSLGGNTNPLYTSTQTSLRAYQPTTINNQKYKNNPYQDPMGYR